MQLWTILTLWWLSIAANAWLMVRLVSQRLLRRYPAFSLMTAYQLCLSAILLTTSGAMTRVHPYVEIWTLSQWIGGVVQIAVAVEVFWALASHLRDRRFARKLLCFLAVLSALVSLAMGLFGRTWSATYRLSVLLSEHVAIALLCVSLLSLAFIRHAGLAVPRNLKTHVLALSVWFGSAFLGHFLMDATAAQSKFTANLSIVGGQLIAYLLWILKFSASGELAPAQRPALMNDEEFKAYQSETKVINAELARVSLELLRKTAERKRS